MENQTKSNLTRTAIWLGLFILIGLAMRIPAGLDSGYDEASGRYLYTGNDPYYHDRTVHHILETGQNLDFDDGINYPSGRENPNPPLWIWTSAPLAAALEGVSTDPVGLAINILVGVWGAITCIPVYMIGRDLWGRKAGLWAAFLITVSAPHIQRSVSGYADHDAITIFFLTLMFAFLLKSLRAARPGPEEGGLGASIKAALANRISILYAALAGTCLTAMALVWKGYPYAAAILGLAAAVQLVVDHLRRRDGSGAWTTYMVALVMGAVLPWVLYYSQFTRYFGSTVEPTGFIAIAVLVTGLVFLAARKLPSILVVPGYVLGVAATIAALFIVVPDLAHRFVTGLGYFEQTRLYTTIAEAQRPSLGFVAANFAFFSFLLVFWGLGWTLKGVWKGDKQLVLMASLTAVSVFMAFAASRFISNSAPIFAVLIGACIARLFEKIGMDDVRRKFRSGYGQGAVGRSARSLTAKTTLGVLGIGLLLIVPNVWLGVDAALPRDFERDNGLVDPTSNNNKLGAFGIDFELSGNGWLGTMNHLATLDQGLAESERPAFIGWWDYGHWAISIGKHPTVADPFQDHHVVAGRFLSAESENEGLALLGLLLAYGDWIADGPGYSPAMRTALAPFQLQDTGLAPEPEHLEILRGKGLLEGGKTAEFYEATMEGSGKDIRYLGVDLRMYPLDAQSSPGIFYAPVFLAGKNPDEFVPVFLTTGSQQFKIVNYGTADDGSSFRLDSARFEDASGNEWVTYQGYLYRKGQTPLQGFDLESGINLGSVREVVQPTQRFYSSMYAMAYGSPVVGQGQAPGDGLAHWRVIQQSLRTAGEVEVRDTVLLRYSLGAEVTGRVLDESGAPMTGIEVGVQDGSGAVHGSVQPAVDGTFTVRAPPSMDDDLKIAVRSGGVTVFTATPAGLQVSEAQADSGARVTIGDVTVPLGSLSGRVYVDNDGSGTFTDGDQPVGGAYVVSGAINVTADASGMYTMTGLPLGTQSVRAGMQGYTGSARSVNIGADGTTQDLTLTEKMSAVSFQFLDYDAAPINAVNVAFAGPTTITSSTGSTGTGTVQLRPGDYTATVDMTSTDGSGNAVIYKGTQAFNVPFGGASQTVTIQRS